MVVSPWLFAVLTRRMVLPGFEGMDGRGNPALHQELEEVCLRPDEPVGSHFARRRTHRQRSKLTASKMLKEAEEVFIRQSRESGLDCLLYRLHSAARYRLKTSLHKERLCMISFRSEIFGEWQSCCRPAVKRPSETTKKTRTMAKPSPPVDPKANKVRGTLPHSTASSFQLFENYPFFRPPDIFDK